MRYYGVIDEAHLRALAIEVCECLGYGHNKNALELLIETANAETDGGHTRDKTFGAGMGLTQFDELPFEDTRERCREADKLSVKDYFDIDIDLIEWEHLRYNPLLSLIFTRLKYKKIPEPIPVTLAGRANYWKINYNSLLGRGTVEHYIDATLHA